MKFQNWLKYFAITVLKSDQIQTASDLRKDLHQDVSTGLETVIESTSSMKLESIEIKQEQLSKKLTCQAEKISDSSSRRTQKFKTIRLSLIVERPQKWILKCSELIEQIEFAICIFERKLDAHDVFHVLFRVEEYWNKVWAHTVSNLAKKMCDVTKN